MKIAIVNTWAISKNAIGGTERFVMDLAKTFAESNNQVDVFMFSGKSHKEDGVNYININLFDMDGEADEYIVQNAFGSFETDKSYIDLSKKLESKIDMTEYDFIQLNSLLFLETWTSKKRIFTIHTNPFEYELAWGEKSYKKMLEIMRKYKDDKLTKFVAPSKFYANEYSKLTDCYINFIPHAINLTRLETTKTKREINNYYNLNNEKLKIIVPSRLEPKQKQPQLLLDACSLMNDDDKLKFEIIYTGLDKQYKKFANSLTTKAKENNVDIKIMRFNDMSEVYKIADVCVLPSKSESFGYSALESLSLGIFTILNDIPTFNEIAEGNYNKYIFKNNVDELRNKLLYIINNYDKFKRKSPNKQWQMKYTMERFANSYINAIK